MELKPIPGEPRSISDDDLCALCHDCEYRPGGMSGCSENWPGLKDDDGYVGLALISLIPIGTVRLLIWAGMDQLAGPLHLLETLLLTVDIALFGVVFLSGVAVFLAETLASTIRQVKLAWRDHG